jgi:hypothetical protein
LALGRVNGKLVLFDDLHGGNVKIAPKWESRGFDAINRELTPEEVKKLQEWRSLSI